MRLYLYLRHSAEGGLGAWRLGMRIVQSIRSRWEVRYAVYVTQLTVIEREHYSLLVERLTSQVATVICNM